MKLIWTILICYATTKIVWAIKFPNDIEGSPTIQCSQDTILINVVTSNNNASKIFAKGHYEDNKCSFQNTNSATFSLSACGMTRQRQLEPRGISYDLVVVVQLHPMFITKVDRAYNLKCFYMESEKFVTSNLEVSMIRTDLITANNPMPQCSYSLHLESANGPLVKYTKVGDKVFHVWECPSDVYGILVHSCYVTDGQGNNFQIVDQNGCGVDKYVIRTPEYSNELTRCQQETHVFKFADRMVLFFNCQIKLCVKTTGGCSGITPPDCPATSGTAVSNPTPSGQTSGGRTEQTTAAGSSTTFPAPPTFRGENITSNFTSDNGTHGDNTTGRSSPIHIITGEAVLHSNSEEFYKSKSTVGLFANTNEISSAVGDKNESELFANETAEFHNALSNITKHNSNSSIMEQLDTGNDTELLLMKADNETIHKNLYAKSVLTDKQSVPFVKVVLNLNNSTKNNSSHFVDPSIDEGSGEDADGFLFFSKNSTPKEKSKRLNVITPLQRDEPNIRKFRRLADSYPSGADLETDVNQQMWVLEPEETGQESDDRAKHGKELPTGQFKIFDQNKNENELHICLPNWGFGFIIATLVILLMILIVCVICIGAKKSHFNNVSDIITARDVYKYQS